MDILSHGLYGGVVFGRKNKKSFWLSFWFGIMPDLLSFGVFMSAAILGLVEHPSFFSGQHPPAWQIPEYVHQLYGVTHSLVVFALAFGLVWIVRKKPLWEMSAWGLHVVMDIFTHSNNFFPTPFLWPISTFHINGHSWGTPEIFIPNLILIAILYVWFFIRHRRKQVAASR